MSDDPATIGIMHPAFRVSKRELLGWINDFFAVNYTKVEECATGAIYCQVCEAIWPGKVPLHKVKWDARSDYQFAENFKIVQGVFSKMGIQKPIPTTKLINAKFQDNLEFLQWFKHFFECKYQGQPYDAAQRRKEAKKGKKLNSSTMASGKTASSRAKTSVTKPTGSATRKTAAKKAVKSSASAAKVDGLETQIAELEVTVEGLKKERDFYYSKLREVEVMCQETEFESNEAATKFKESIVHILYKTDEETDAEAAAGGEEAGEEAGEEKDDEAAGADEGGADETW